MNKITTMQVVHTILAMLAGFQVPVTAQTPNNNAVQNSSYPTVRAVEVNGSKKIEQLSIIVDSEDVHAFSDLERLKSLEIYSTSAQYVQNWLQQHQPLPISLVNLHIKLRHVHASPRLSTAKMEEEWHALTQNVLQISSLETLKLSNTQSSDSGFDCMFPMPRDWPKSLHSLELSGFSFHNRLSELSASALTHLSLTGETGSRSPTFLSENDWLELKRITGLRSLKLQKCMERIPRVSFAIDFPQLRAIELRGIEATEIVNADGLNSITFNFCTLSPQTLSSIASSPSLENLELFGCLCLGDLSSLFHQENLFGNLRCLTLGNVTADLLRLIEAAPATAEVIVSWTKSLEDLKLEAVTSLNYGDESFDMQDIDRLRTATKLKKITVIPKKLHLASFRSLCLLPQLTDICVYYDKPAESPASMREAAAEDTSPELRHKETRKPLALHLIAYERGETICSAIPQSVRLQSLTVEWGDLSASSLDHLPDKGLLKSLSLLHVQVAPELITRLDQFPNLKTLELVCLDLTDDLVKKIPRLEHLERLNLTNNFDLTIDEISRLSARQSLKILDIRGTEIEWNEYPSLRVPDIFLGRFDTGIRIDLR